MKQVDSREDELRALVVSAFDSTTPETYEKYRMLNDIEEKAENSSSRKTSMQLTFIIRRLCISCIIIFLVVLVSGGTYTAVSRLQGFFKEQNSGVRYKELLIAALGGEYDGVLETRITDNRYAEALSEDEKPVTTEESGDFKIAFIGPLTKAGLSDYIFRKAEESTFITVAVNNGDSDSENDITDVEYRINVDGKDINDNIYPLDSVYELDIEGIHYSVLDITEYGVFAGRDIKLKVVNADEAVMYPLDFNNAGYDDYEADACLKRIEAYKTLSDDAGNSNSDKEYDEKRTQKMLAESKKFLLKHKRETEEDRVKFVIGDKAWFFERQSQPGVGGYPYENSLLRERKSYGPFFGDTIQIKGNDIESITIKVTGAVILNEKKMSRQNEKSYQASYMGSLICPETDSYRNGKDEQYNVYLNMGDSITIPYSDFEKEITSYGLYITEAAPDYSKAEDYIDACALRDDWEQIYLSDKVSVEVTANRKGSSVSKTIVFDFMWTGSGTDGNGKMKKTGRLLYGWE